MKQGLDRAFLEYGIRRHDLVVITELCAKYNLDADWVKDVILKSYHEKKVDSIEMNDNDTEKLIEKALQKLK